MTKQKTRGIGITMADFLSILTIVFIILKLIGEITWSWWWIISPMWIPIFITVVVTVLYMIARRLLTKKFSSKEQQNDKKQQNNKTSKMKDYEQN